MANVVLNSFLLQFIGEDFIQEGSSEESIVIEANIVRDVIKALEKQFPEIGDQLRSGVAIAIDGEIFSDPLLQELEEDSEVYFLPAIEGG
ncbi:MAG: MoaD/ThiS family protein [Cellvibrionaceae bacterium]